MTAPERITSLSKVREALDKTTSEHKTLLVTLMKNGKNRPWSCKPAQRLVFGPNENDFPGLGKKLAPFDMNALPSPKDLRALLVVDFWVAREQYGQHSHTAEERALSLDAEYEDPDLELLNSLAKADNNVESVVLSFPSPSLDEICGDAKVEYDNVLRESMTTATILPRDTLLSLQHSNEGTTFTTLLSGAVAWFIWPPTSHNLNILKNCYENFAESFDSTNLNVTGEFKGGVCLIQTVGEALRIPPFCPMICLSLEASVLATYSIVTVSQLAGMLRRLPLLLAWFKTEIDGERKKQEFTAALLPHFDAILQGSFETADLKKHKYPYLVEGPLHSLLHNWDEIKHAVASTLDATEAERVKTVWKKFLHKAKGPECWICGESISNKLRNMRKHFESTHWPADKVTKASMQRPTPQVTPKEAVTPPVVPNGIEMESTDNAMDTAASQKGTPKEKSKKVVAPPFVLNKTGAGAFEDLMELGKAPETPAHFC